MASESVKSEGKKMYKTQVLRPLDLGREKGKQEIRNPGALIEMTEEEKKLYCDLVFTGPYAFVGERIGDNRRHQVVRARVVSDAEWEELQKKAAAAAAA